MNKQEHEQFYCSAETKLYEVDDASIAVRLYGRGPALVLVHGFPVHGYTWRRVLPVLGKHFSCYVVDLPGLGDSRWNSKTNFTFTAQARRLARLVDVLQIKSYSILAQDTGATVARLIAAAGSSSLRRLAIINTEMPHHRPPWIPLYRHLASLPGANFIFRWVFNSFVARTSMGLKGFYSDPALLNDPASLGPYLGPLVKSAQRMSGALGYLRGIEWKVVDNLVHAHPMIKAETMLIWGENDKIFPVELAEKMSKQFAPACQFVRIGGAELMPHEERPDQVLECLIPFLTKNETNRSLERI